METSYHGGPSTLTFVPLVLGWWAKCEYMDGRAQIYSHAPAERFQKILSKEQEMEMFLGTSALTEYPRVALDVKP